MRANAGDQTGAGSPARKSGFFVSSPISAAISRLLLAIAFIVSFSLGTISIVSAQATPVASPAVEPVSPEAALDAAVAWLVAQQDPSGAFLGFSGEPDPGTTIDAVLALVSAPAGDAAVVDAAVAYLQANAAPYAEAGAGQAAKLVLAMTATGGDPSSVNGIDPLALVKASVDEESGICGFGLYDHALCMMAVAAAGEDVPAEWIETLTRGQIDNGGWAFDGSKELAMADSNTTAMAIEALVAAGVDPSDAVIQTGLGYLKTVLAPEGGFAYAVAEPLIADANSTGIAIQALIAAGEDILSADWGTPLNAMAAFQNESGAFRYMNDVPDDNLFATVQAIPALAGVAFPISNTQA